MLNIIRKNAQSLVIQAVVVIIALVFIFWGVGGKLRNSSNAMAVVNGKEIGFRDFQQSYDRAADQYQQQFGGQLPENFLKSIHLKEQVAQQLVQRELLRQGAEAAGIHISEEAIQRKIKMIPTFTRNGHFDMDQYQSVLEQNRLSPTTFENSISNDLLLDRTTELIGDFAEMPAAEMQHWLNYLDQELKLNYAEISPKAYRAEVEVNDTSLEEWYGAHKLSYKTAPQAKLAYLSFAYDDFAQSETLSEETLRSYYTNHLKEYQVPEKRRARHILFKVAEGADEQVKAAKKAEAEKVLKEIQAGADFAEMAKKYSEDSSKDRGGDLGFFGRGEMVPTFDQAAFSLKAGGLSGVVASPFGYHLIKVEEVQPEKTRSFDEVSATIREKLSQKDAHALAFKKASTTYEAIIRAGSLAKYSEQEHVSIAHTEFFAQAAPPEMTMVKDAQFLQAAFALRKGELSSIVETGSGYAIIFAEDVKEPEVPELAAVREQVEKDYVQEKSKELARKAAETYLASLKEKHSWPAGLEKKEGDYVKRMGDSELPEIIRKDAFARLGLGTLPEVVLTQGDLFYIYEITDSRIGKSELDESKRKSLEQQFLAAQKNVLLTSWLGQLQKDAKIWINNQMLQ
ncbi:SurA N-terminal domain-containing protein [Desulfobulbus rhabdoformis]|uniref:peptidylprolyl isomerase n=1 Tax=Desulfobulbus rhabdoformis TaxID=34032 RepID=UPI0019634DD7|nr:peptidylprolyl isomerase [Desulfobulbus rhabdoformis]MBM9613380.1 SurA N-terminal domain-containing protein [Desulfobulbus rhabdoformis]